MMFFARKAVYAVVVGNALSAYLFEDEVGTNFFGYGGTIF